MSQATEPLIVVGVDGSKHSKEALRWAVRQATLVGGRVHAVMSWEWSTNPFSFGPADGATVAGGSEPLSPEETSRVRLIDVVTETVGESPPVPVHSRMVHGPAAKVLVEASGAAELLVVGTRGYGGFKGALLGSVSQQVTQHAHCSVVVVRHKSDS
ncbi:universal stress protein [Streptomyces sp. NBC_01003]|uniref:universal stress protein n=1 Tax=Streptomyces sp. NBC_01003 TaxID=2903714 RepID=UPI0038643334|nr:universal stress protein [Streptomyces sp. NBC_01003]